MGDNSTNVEGLLLVVGYVPNIAAASAMIAIFTIVAAVAMGLGYVVHSRGARGRCCGCSCCCGCGNFWHYTTVLPTVAILELIGYAERRDMTLEFGAWSYLISTATVLIAPVILAVMNYKAVCHLLIAANVRILCMSARTLNRVFISVDVVCAIMQFGGSVCATLAMAMNMSLMRDIADDLLITSFVIQLLLNLAFTVLIAWMYRQPLFSPQSTRVPNMGKVWRTVFVTVALIWVRNIFRAAEGFANAEGHLVSNEGLFYAFDTLPIALCCVFFCACHYGYLLPTNESELAMLFSGADFTQTRSGAFDVVEVGSDCDVGTLPVH